MPTQPIRFGIIVTGRGEAMALHEPFNAALAKLGSCVFEIVRKFEQLRPRKDPGTPIRLRMTGTSKPLPTRDQELGLAALGYLRQDAEHRYLLVVDDLERDEPAAVFRRYRDALDAVLAKPGFAHRASVHFLVNMLEAYFFAHADAVNSVAGSDVLAGDHTSDVEQIPHPKGELSGIWPAYRETHHGIQVTKRLDMGHILSRPEQCRWLRATFAWCVKHLDAHNALYSTLDPSLFQLEHGCKANLILTQKFET